MSYNKCKETHGPYIPAMYVIATDGGQFFIKAVVLNSFFKESNWQKIDTSVEIEWEQFRNWGEKVLKAVKSYFKDLSSFFYYCKLFFVWQLTSAKDTVIQSMYQKVAAKCDIISERSVLLQRPTCLF